jgi:hypothetical protein
MTFHRNNRNNLLHLSSALHWKDGWILQVNVQ